MKYLSKLKDRGFQATSLSTYDSSNLNTTLPHNLIKDKLLDLIERTFSKKEGKLYLACNDNIYIRFGTKLYRQIVGIPMGTNCAPLVAALLLFLL